MNNLKAKVYKGRHETVGSTPLVRSLPNPKFNAIGSIVFLDHVVEKTHEPKTAKMPDGSFAHPHRGIATFTYIIEGGIHHLDSNGGEGKVYKGGIQWMKSGNGIVHDEFAPYDLQEKGGKFHAFQFWLNLPGKNKAESPDYLAIQGEDIAEVQLANDSGLLRVLLGEYEGRKSVIPTYLGQSIYHIKLAAGKSMDLPVDQQWEYGIYVINGKVKVNNQIDVDQLEMAQLYGFEEHLKISNEGNEAVDLIVLGGEPYTEPAISYGPFIMNNQDEIALAYSDYKKGKYGNIDYSSVKI